MYHFCAQGEKGCWITEEAMADSENQLNPPQQVSYPPASYSAQAHQPQYNSQALGKWLAYNMDLIL